MAEDLIDKIFSLISKDYEAGSEKQIILRQILRNLTENRHARFFKFKTEEIDVSFAQFIYTIYKAVSPFLSFLKDSSRLSRLKSTTLELFLDKETLNLARRLTVKTVEERAQNTNSEALANELTGELEKLVQFFTEEKKREIDESHILATAFIHLARFDFLSLFKRFDPAFTTTAGYVPKFHPVKALNITKELETLQPLFMNMNPERNWQAAFKVLTACCNGAEPLPLDAWITTVKLIWDIQTSNIMELMVQVIRRDPIWQSRPQSLEENLSDSWLEAKKLEIQRMIDKIVHQERSTQIEAIATKIFGSPGISRLRNYSIQNHVYLIERDLIGYTLAPGLNYLLAFLVDCLNRDIQDFIEQILVRGQWTTQSDSREMSESYYLLKDKIEEILAFDETLSEDEKDGARLKSALSRLEREKSQIRFINTFLNGINEEAQEIIDTTLPAMKILEYYFKSFDNDVQKKGRAVILNWKDLGGITKLPVPQQVSEINEQFRAMIELLNFFKTPAGN